ncbi:hypothetical protein cypCar_00050079, partial [Cyprinus carpio]
RPPLQDLLQNSSPSLTSVSSTVNPSGIVVPAGSLQQNNVAMTTINSQVVSGGTLYQPVAMVTSQGQVLTQGLPHGTIQIQNNQIKHLKPQNDVNQKKIVTLACIQ